jgi:hypothetical protein
MEKHVLADVLNQQIQLGVEAMYGGVIAGPDPSTISFRHLLTRVMMVLQVPVTFVVFKRRSPSGAFEATYRANKHPRHQSDIQRRIDSVKRNDLFPLFHGTEAQTKNYFLLVLKADSNSSALEPGVTTQPYRFEILKPHLDIEAIVSVWDAASYKLSKLLSAESFAAYSINGNSGLLDFLRGSIERCVDNLNAALPPQFQDVKQAGSQATNQFAFYMNAIEHTTTKYEIRGDGVADRVFKKLQKNVSTLTSGDDKNDHIANFLLFIRHYTNTGSGWYRHGDGKYGYQYNIRVVIGENQKEQIIEYLNRLKLEGRGGNHGRVIGAAIARTQNGDARRIANDVDNFFWMQLEESKKDNEVIDRMVEMLQQNFGKSARSMADPVFDGVSFFRAPFSDDAGVRRCFADGTDLSKVDFSQIPEDSDSRHDLLRVVMCQYLFEEMASSDHGDGLDLWVMLNPIEIGGRVWGVVSYVTRSTALNARLESDVDIRRFHFYWLQNYHVYRDINERAKRNLRTLMGTLYESTVGRVYASEVDRVSKAQKKGIKQRVTEVEKVINNYLLTLCCFFPYDAVQISLNRSPGVPFPSPNGRKGHDTRSTIATFSEDLGARVFVRKNPIFQSCDGISASAELAITRRFVDLTDMAVSMTDAVRNQAIVHFVEDENNL